MKTLSKSLSASNRAKAATAGRKAKANGYMPEPVEFPNQSPNVSKSPGIQVNPVFTGNPGKTDEKPEIVEDNDGYQWEVPF